MSRYAQTLRTCALVFTAIILLSVPAVSQVTTGNISGRVLDSQERGVSGATVTATSSGTGATRTTTTDEAGNYTLPSAWAESKTCGEAPNFKKNGACRSSS